MVGTVVGFALLVLVVGGFLATKVLEARQIVRKARAVDPLVSGMAELGERISELERKTQAIRDVRDLTTGDMNGVPPANV